MIRALLFLLPILPRPLKLELYRAADEEMCVFHPDRIEVCLAFADLTRSA